MGNKKDNKKRLDVEMHQGVNVKRHCPKFCVNRNRIQL